MRLLILELDGPLMRLCHVACKASLVAASMPKIKTSRTKPPPEGYEDIAPVLEDYARKMRDAENEPHEGKRKVESTWNIVRPPFCFLLGVGLARRPPNWKESPWRPAPQLLVYGHHL
jgi:hypothetical protein